MKNLLIASTSTLHDSGYLEYLLPELALHFKNCETIVFIPYARPGGLSHEAYTQKVCEAFTGINLNVKGLHEFESAADAIRDRKSVV